MLPLGAVQGIHSRVSTVSIRKSVSPNEIQESIVKMHSQFVLPSVRGTAYLNAVTCTLNAGRNTDELLFRIVGEKTRMLWLVQGSCVTHRYSQII